MRGHTSFPFIFRGIGVNHGLNLEVNGNQLYSNRVFIVKLKGSNRRPEKWERLRTYLQVVGTKDQLLFRGGCP